MSTKQPDKGDEFEELYLKERKKSSMLLVVAIVLALSTVGSIVWAASNGSSSQQSPQFPNRAPGGEGGLRGGLGGPRGGLDITSFFNDDGSVDTDQVDEITNNSPGGSDSRRTSMVKQQADQAVENGDFTQDQADALIEALESSASNSSSESTNET